MLRTGGIDYALPMDPPPRVWAAAVFAFLSWKGARGAECVAARAVLDVRMLELLRLRNPLLGALPLPSPGLYDMFINLYGLEEIEGAS